MEFQRETAITRDVAHNPVMDRLPADPMEREGVEWGLASLVIGCTLVLGALLFLLLAVITLLAGHNFNHLDTILITSLHSVMTATVLALNLISMFAGLRSVFSARRRGQPIAFGLMGLVISGFALGLWVCACVAGFAVMANF